MCAALALCASSSALAVTINHGDFGPDAPSGFTAYQDVREDSGTDPVPPGLYGPPTLTGNTLDFDPSSFVASANGGGSDITNVQLNFDLDAGDGGLLSLIITESGDYSLFGSGSDATSVAAGVSVSVDIFEVDGAAITPISVFASSSIVRDLVSDGPVVLAGWANELLVDFAAVLAANNIAFELGVTKAEVVIDNQLIAISEAGSVSFIAKKNFTLRPNEGFPPSVPEPSASLLLAPLLVAAGRSLGRRG